MTKIKVVRSSVSPAPPLILALMGLILTTIDDDTEHAVCVGDHDGKLLVSNSYFVDKGVVCNALRLSGRSVAADHLAAVNTNIFIFAVNDCEVVA